MSIQRSPSPSRPPHRLRPFSALTRPPPSSCWPGALFLFLCSFSQLSSVLLSLSGVGSARRSARGWRRMLGGGRRSDAAGEQQQQRRRGRGEGETGPPHSDKHDRTRSTQTQRLEDDSCDAPAGEHRGASRCSPVTRSDLPVHRGCARCGAHRIAVSLRSKSRNRERRRDGRRQEIAVWSGRLGPSATTPERSVLGPGGCVSAVLSLSWHHPASERGQHSDTHSEGRGDRSAQRTRSLFASLWRVDHSRSPLLLRNFRSHFPLLARSLLLSHRARE